MLYCIPKPCLEINSATATAKIAEVTLYAIGSLKNSNRHAESIAIAMINVRVMKLNFLFFCVVDLFICIPIVHVYYKHKRLSKSSDYRTIIHFFDYFR